MGYVCEPLPTDVAVDPDHPRRGRRRAAFPDRWRVGALRVGA